MPPDRNSKGLQLRKLYYSIGEVSEQVGVPAHVLRYWEGEFSQLSPKKGRNGSRLYQQHDVELIEQIKDLLYREKFTIQGARSRLKGQGGENGGDDVLGEVRRELRAILKLMNK